MLHKPLESINQIAFSPRVKKQLRKLRSHIEGTFDKALYELQTGELSNGREFKKDQFFYTIRLNDNYRIAFTIEEEILHIRCVGSHSTIDRYRKIGEL